MTNMSNAERVVWFFISPTDINQLTYYGQRELLVLFFVLSDDNISGFKILHTFTRRPRPSARAK